MRAVYELTLWITSSFFLRNPDFHHGLLGHHVAFSVFEPPGESRCICVTAQGRGAYFEKLRHMAGTYALK